MNTTRPKTAQARLTKVGANKHKDRALIPLIGYVSKKEIINGIFSK